MAGKYLKQAQQQAAKPKKKGKGCLIAFLVILLVLAVIIGCVGYLAYHYMSLIRKPSNTAPTGDTTFTVVFQDEEEETIETTVAPTTVPYADGNYGTTGKIVNILVVGQDAREDENHKNTDTVILVSINKETKVITLSSFLRDSYIKLANYKTHTCGKSKLTFAYALGYQWGGDEGAMEMIDNTLINNYGAVIDYNIEVGLDAFTDIIDILGGIDVVLDEDEYNYLMNDNKLNDDRKLHPADWYKVQVGESHLNAITTLSYARMRHSSASDNDYKRTERQRNVIAQVIEKLKGTSLTELNKLAEKIMGKILTDMSVKDMFTYVTELAPILPYVTIQSQQIPVQGTFSGKIVDLFGDGVEHSVQDVYDLETNRKLIVAACTGVEAE